MSYLKLSWNPFFILLLLAALSNKQASAQSDDDAEKSQSQVYFGLGAGFDYGGLGLKAEFLPAKWIGIFAGGGYNLADPAFNVGFSLKALPDKRVNPMFMAMYGYNAAIRIKNVF